MKTRVLTLSVIAALLAAGCGQKDAAPASAGASSPAAATPSASSGGSTAAPNAANEIALTANDQMKFILGDKQSDPSGNFTLEAKANSPLKITLTNNGSVPKEAMGHNFILLKPGSDPLAFSAAAGGAKDTDYVPASLKDQVIAHTKLLGPKQSDEITVTLAPGEYPFLCSFPGHAPVGMRGKLIVK